MQSTTGTVLMPVRSARASRCHHRAATRHRPLAFFATPFLLLGIPGDVVALVVASVALGLFLLFIERLRSVGVGLLAGTLVTLGVLLLLGTMLSGVD